MDPQTAEAGEAYLNALGFRSLIEWVTAEALLARPDDPLTFIRSLLDEKLSEVCRLSDLEEGGSDDTSCVTAAQAGREVPG